jgi:hypothetical protein
MAQLDWKNIVGSAVAPDVERGVSAAITPPNGGGTFVYGVNSISLVNDVAGIYVDLVGVSPTSSGVRVSAALQRGASGNSTGQASYIWVQSTGTGIADTAYILGLSDADPSRIILRKGRVVDGLPDLTPDPLTNGNLLASTATYSQGEWVHIRLSAIVQDTGDVLLRVEQNEDIGTNPVTAPVWTVPAGMEGTGSITGFIDDTLQVNTGSAPLASGYIGVAFRLDGIGQRGFVDHYQPAYQT